MVRDAVPYLHDCELDLQTQYQWHANPWWWCPRRCLRAWVTAVPWTLSGQGIPMRQNNTGLLIFLWGQLTMCDCCSDKTLIQIVTYISPTVHHDINFFLNYFFLNIWPWNLQDVYKWLLLSNKTENTLHAQRVLLPVRKLSFLFGFFFSKLVIVFSSSP